MRLFKQKNTFIDVIPICRYVNTFFGSYRNCTHVLWAQIIPA